MDNIVAHALVRAVLAIVFWMRRIAAAPIAMKIGWSGVAPRSRWH
jgi:hypothetical protein